MKAYLDLLRHVRQHGEIRQDRTGTGTLGIFGAQLRFDLADGFPLVTTKKVHLKSIIHELLWFLSGSTQNSWLTERGVTIWNEWATAEQCAKFGRKEGDLGPVYGHQWRRFGAHQLPDGTYAPDGIDQIKRLLEEIRRNPASRRLIVTGWNPREADQVALPPLPHVVPVPRLHGPTLKLPTLPAQCGPLPRRALQHRQLCPPDAHDCTSFGPKTGAFRAYLWRRPHLLEPPRASRFTAHTRPPAAASIKIKPCSHGPFRL